MKTSRIKDTKSKDVLEEIICENLDNLFEELEELSKFEENDYKLSGGITSEKRGGREG